MARATARTNPAEAVILIFNAIGSITRPCLALESLMFPYLFPDDLGKSLRLCITYRRCISSSPDLAHMLAWEKRCTHVIFTISSSVDTVLCDISGQFLTDHFPVYHFSYLTIQHYPTPNFPESKAGSGGGSPLLVRRSLVGFSHLHSLA